MAEHPVRIGETRIRFPPGPPMEEILKDLNQNQIEAIKAIEGPVLIIAGPGSGKTATLTRRIAYMIASGIKPENILAITFTNKASQEMKERVEKLLGISPLTSSGRLAAMPLVGTFHSVCARILRNEARTLGFSKNFTIYDEDDQLGLTKKVMEDLGFSPKNFNPYSILNRISKLKSGLIDSSQFEKQAINYYEKTISQIYSAYQKELQKANAMDFDDLIMLTVKLFEKNPQITEKYQNQFKYILVDEYQDTNISQYVLTKILAAKYRNLFAIGDTDQSIYTWRYADFRNMLNFEKDFPEAKIIRLEQNYRSTKIILTAGQGLIKNNVYRHQKELWTENADGEKISIAQLDDEKEEAKFIIEKMKQLISAKGGPASGGQKGYKLNDFVILYRTHAQSRPIEEEFLTQGFPYKIIGALKFYERREVKDILAYLRILANPNDFISLQRIYNVPTRGIGKVAFLRLIEFGRKNNLNLFESLIKAKEIDNLPVKSQFALYAFGKTLEKIKEKINDFELTKLMKYIVNEIDYKTHLDTKTEEGYMRWENVKELLTVARKYNSFKTDEAMGKFLEEVALIQETENIDEDKNVIYMMTLHSAKGLEFPVVFLVGAEEGLLPHSKSLDNPIELEEERRLCYVGITRAKRRVFITFARSRMIFGTTSQGISSRFLEEIPKDTVEFVSNLESSEENEIINYT
ncbi:MAG: DNA helicase II / ATP-dependent DNA helicase PcrA [Parcubacteria group bacterium Gr01-1014_2]|nr:MAG: DNA helicase II / ATP-dependent DNA helicase PcrA [Parcubacteria group bacterium Gr01-1014_2]